MEKIKNQLTATIVLLTGIISHHYESKLLEYRENMGPAKEQDLKDLAMSQDLGLIKNELSTLTASSKALTHKIDGLNNNIADVQVSLVNKTLEQSQAESIKSILEKGSEQITPEYYSRAYKAALNCQESFSKTVLAVRDLIGDITKSNFLPDLTYINYYLNSLSLLELSSLFNIFILLLICMLMINIIITLTSNELISYLNLDIRFPKLSKILKLRMRIQHYYIILNFILIFVLAIGAILLNSLVLV